LRLRRAICRSPASRPAARLRAAGAQVVIVAAHAGTSCRDFTSPADTSSCDRDGEIVRVARELPPSLVDVIVAGHVHAGVAHEIHGIAVVAAYANGRAFGRVDLQVDRARGIVVGRTIFPPRHACARVTADTAACAPAGAADAVAATYEGAAVRASDLVQRLLAPALEVAERLKEEPVGAVLASPVRRLAGRDSPLGNLFTDALLYAVPAADVALHNTTGGLRADLPAGALNYGHLYEVMPFDNRLVVVALTGEQLRTVLESHLQRTTRRLGVAGVRVRIRCSGTGVQVDLHRASGAPVRDDDTVRVVVGDFLATGGDEILTPILPPGGLAIEADGPLARDALAGYLRHLGKELREEHFLAPDELRTFHRERLPATCERAAVRPVVH
jgi:5'-nucleotidase